MNIIKQCDCTQLLESLDEGSIDMIYVDPPFNTGRTQTSARSGISYSDYRSDYVQWITSWLHASRCVMKSSGTIYVHIDERVSHIVRTAMDSVFGTDNWLNTVIWAYDFGGRGKKKWPTKHDCIIAYVKDKDQHIFNWNEIDRIPYMAPGLQKDPKRAAEGKVPTDTWWMSIIGTQSKERLGYPTQKPVKLVERAIRASCRPGGTVLDFFAGSGTTGHAAINCDRNFVLCDTSDDAIAIMKDRFDGLGVKYDEQLNSASSAE